MPEVMTHPFKIKFGTDGWRGIIAKEYTVNNLKRVAVSYGRWIKSKHPEKTPSIVIGYDCRFGGELFSATVAMVFSSMDIKVFLSKDFASTPMVSLGILKLKADGGVVITASHNPSAYNGFKLKAEFGGPGLPEMVQEIEAEIPDNVDITHKNLNELVDEKIVEYVDLEEMYFVHIKANFNIDLINEKVNFAYDAMFGAGQKVSRRLFPNAHLLHCSFNPSFDGMQPEPLHKNLIELSDLIKADPAIMCGLATDGDADRLGWYDDAGNFIDSHHIILLLIHYMVKYKNKSGKVIVSFTVSDKVKKLCEHYKIPIEITKVGFKYITRFLLEDDALLGGEESGGIALQGHIPERDGIWVGATLLEFMAETGKSINDLIKEVYDIVGPFAYDRNDLQITQEKKEYVMDQCSKNAYKSFGPYQVTGTNSIDGYKYYLGENQMTMIRQSGTEPVLRIYCEAENMEKVKDILGHVQKTILGED